MTDLEMKQLKEDLKKANIDGLMSAYICACTTIGEYDSDYRQILTDEIRARGYEVKWEG